MFKPFEIDYMEFPYIDIKIGEGCPAACTDCRFNIDYLISTKQFSLDNVIKRIDEVDKRFDKKFNLVFGNQDGLNHKNIIEILTRGLNKGREIRFQIDFDIKKEHLNLLKKIEEKLGFENIDIKIAKNCRGVENLSEKIVVLLKSLSSNTKFKIYIDLFLDFGENRSIIDTFLKHLKDTSGENQYDVNIGKNINVKFHNYSWKLDRANKCFTNLPRHSCQQLDQLSIKNGDIFLKDSLDIYDNGDLFMHDNLCNIGDIRISNLYLSDDEIYNNFDQYLENLRKLKDKHKNQSDMCFDCITHGFKYTKNK